MRVISQDGKTDYPYENSVVYVVENEIFISCNGEDDIVATYDTEEKATAIIELLRYVYCDVTYCFKKLKFFKDEDNITLIKDTKDNKFSFKFPKDREVELCN